MEFYLLKIVSFLDEMNFLRKLYRDIIVNISLQYDFKTENGFTEWLKDNEKEAQRLAEQKKREAEDKERLRREAEQTTTVSEEPRSTETVKPPETAAVSKPAATSVEPVKTVTSFPSVSNVILLPERASSVTVMATSATNGLSKPSSQINISDFESLAEDPFDNMELKTINDMQVLESVLANTQAQQMSGNASATGNTDMVTTDTRMPEGHDDSPIYENPVEITARANNIYSNVVLNSTTHTVPSDNLLKKRRRLRRRVLHPVQRTSL